MADKLALVEEQPILRIVYETDELIPARQVGIMLDRVGAAFVSYVKDQRSYGSVRLAVLSIETGSLIASLVAVGQAVDTLIEQRNVIGGFLNHIGDVVMMMAGKLPSAPKAVDRKAVDALAGPIANGKAIQININVTGSHNNIVVDRSTIDAFREHQEAEALNVAQNRLVDRLTQDAIGRHADLFTGNKALVGTTPALFHYDAIEGGVNGEAFKIRGNWYVRLDDQQGILNPADLGIGVFLIEGQRYRFKGRWNGVRYDLTSARVI